MSEGRDIRVLGGSTADGRERKSNFVRSIRDRPIPDSELVENCGLYLTRQAMSGIVLMHDLYKRIIRAHGMVIEFGVRWGQNMALFTNLRGMYEPFNYNRKIVGFDTFDGFPSVAEEDGFQAGIGDYAVTDGWREDLERLLEFHDSNQPIPQKRKYELAVGDATETLPEYLSARPETVVALAYFDFDLYQPTKRCLQALLPHLTKGSILAFDELNCPESLGEALAVREVLGLSQHALCRDPNNPLASWIVIE